MKVVAKISGENPELVKFLTGKGVSAKLVKNGVVVELPYAEGSEKRRNPASEHLFGEKVSGIKYSIPEEIKDAQLFIDCVEKGGGMTNTGDGTVVCGISGKKLRPYYVPRSGNLCNGTHGYFSVPNAIITVTGFRHDQNINIKKYMIVINNGIAEIKEEELWRGELDSLPNSFSQYFEAAKAASEKGNCYHCRDLHFSEEKK